jgi:hypothetical protein
MDDLIDMLSDYTDLGERGKMHLKDELLDLSGHLHDEGITEGWRYEESMLLIKKGDPLPQPHTKMTVESPLTNEMHTFDIKEISELRWNENGDLIIGFVGKKAK